MYKSKDINEEFLIKKVEDKFGLDVRVFIPKEENITCVKILRNNKYFLINYEGDYILPEGYDEILFASEIPARSIYYYDEYINKQDVYSNQYSIDHIAFNKDIVIVNNNEKHGVYNIDGSEVIPVEYEKIIWISRDRIIVCKGEKYGLVDTKGKYLISCKYDELRPIPFIKTYGYSEDNKYIEYPQDIKLIVAKIKEKTECGYNRFGRYGYIYSGFNMNGELIISTCLGINLGESFSVIDTFGEFPYTCAEIFTNLILEIDLNSYFLLNLKKIGFDYSQYIDENQESEGCIDHVCGKIIGND
jgi:WG containing repeat